MMQSIFCMRFWLRFISFWSIMVHPWPHHYTFMTHTWLHSSSQVMNVLAKLFNANLHIKLSILLHFFILQYRYLRCISKIVQPSKSIFHMIRNLHCSYIYYINNNHTLNISLIILKTKNRSNMNLSLLFRHPLKSWFF